MGRFEDHIPEHCRSAFMQPTVGKITRSGILNNLNLNISLEDDEVEGLKQENQTPSELSTSSSGGEDSGSTGHSSGATNSTLIYVPSSVESAEIEDIYARKRFYNSEHSSSREEGMEGEGIQGENGERVTNVEVTHSSASTASPPTPNGLSLGGRTLNKHYCSNCHTVLQSSKGNLVGSELPKPSHDHLGFWNYKHSQLRRDPSFHSVGGFTLNGQYNTEAQKSKKMTKFCSSHKIALVVSTFSMLVTIGLVITLLLMKERGMMQNM